MTPSLSHFTQLVHVIMIISSEVDCQMMPTENLTSYLTVSEAFLVGHGMPKH